MSSNAARALLTDLEWQRLEELAAGLARPGVRLGTIPGAEWRLIQEALKVLMSVNDGPGILRLREVFKELYARDTMTGLDVLRQLDGQAIAAARLMQNRAELAHLLGARGHNLHRQGYHLEAIQAFDESARCYWTISEEFAGLESYYMTSLCYRALGERDRARQILADVLDRVPSGNPWRANPTQVMAWLLQDDGKLEEAEALLRQSLRGYENLRDSDLLIAGALADLAEIVGISGRAQEARRLFEESLAILEKHQGQYDRQEARTLLKYSELLIHQKDYQAARSLLKRADGQASRYGHYLDLLWQIELAQAYLFLRGRDLPKCWMKIRSVFRLRQLLGLSNALLMKYVFQRYGQRLWRARRSHAN